MLHLTEHKSKKGHNTKMDGFTSINVSVKENEFCSYMQTCQKSICSKCYTKQSAYPNLEAALLRNTAILTDANFVPVGINRTIIRLHSFGELYGTVHFTNIIKLVNYNPNTKFVLWTKRADVVKEVLQYTAKPKNLTLIYSSPMLNVKAKKPAKFDKVFTVYDKKYIAEHGVDINCGSKNCMSCMLCYSKNNTVFINEKLK